MIRFEDRFDFAWQTIRTQRLRSLLTVAGIVMGIASVIALTALGDGVKTYINNQFSQFGTGLIILTPGKTDLFGIPGNLGGTYQDITFADCRVLERLPGIVAVAPVIGGTATIEFDGRSRAVQVYGVTGAGRKVWDIDLRQGRYIETEVDGEGAADVIIGSKIQEEIFRGSNPLGSRLRIGETGFRVVGVTERKGEMMGIDVNDSVTIAAARAMRLFNNGDIKEVDIKVADPDNVDTVIARIKETLIDRHREEDFTIMSQEELISSMGSIMDVMKFAVTAIAGVSLFVGGVGILTIMWIGVHERRDEIGLMKALGATGSDVRRQFLTEAALLSLCGGVLGTICGHVFIFALVFAVPSLPARVDPAITLLSLGVALFVGLLAGFAPAARAGEMEPADALRSL